MENLLNALSIEIKNESQLWPNMLSNKAMIIAQIAKN